MKHFTSLLGCAAALALLSACQTHEDCSLGNGRVCISFDAENGWPVAMTDLSTGEEMLDGSVPLWELRDARDSVIREGFVLLGSRRSRTGTLKLSWKTKSGVKLSARATLAPEDSLVHWGLSVAGLEPGSAVRFPILSFKKMENEDFAFSSWLGRIERDPRSALSPEKPLIRFSTSSPGQLSMQLIAAYDRERGCGIYLAGNDTLSFSKDFTVELDSVRTLFYLTHYPALTGPSKHWDPG